MDIKVPQKYKTTDGKGKKVKLADTKLTGTKKRIIWDIPLFAAL